MKKKSRQKIFVVKNYPSFMIIGWLIIVKIWNVFVSITIIQILNLINLPFILVWL